MSIASNQSTKTLEQVLLEDDQALCSTNQTNPNLTAIGFGNIPLQRIIQPPGLNSAKRTVAAVLI
jgi:hypothetical protein